MKRRFKVTSIINLTNIILVLSSTIVSSIFYISASEGIKNKLIKSLNTQNEQYSSSLESLFVQLLEISSKISNHNEVKLLKSYYFDKKGDNFGKVEALNTLDDNLDTFNFLSSYVYTVAAYFKPEGDLSYGIRHASSSSNPLTEIDEVLTDYTFSEYPDHVLIHKNNLYYLFSDDAVDTFKICVQLNINDLSSFFNIETNTITQYGSYYFIGDKFVYSFSNYINTAEEIEKENFSGYRNPSHYVYYSKFNETILLRHSLDLNSLADNYNLPIFYFIIGIALLLILSMASILLQQYLMKRPIKEIQKALVAISNGDFSYRIPYTTKSDLQELFDGINHTAEMLNEYINEHYIQEIQVKDANFKVLQSQIHPHFLYNCFATIQSLIKLGEYEKAGILTKELSLYYSYITKNKKMLVSLKEEWDHMIRYLKIQKIRFEDNVTYEIDEINEKIENYTVPKVIFQPIVENCFKYAFKNIDDGKLKISYIEDDEYFYITFEDNGKIEDEEIIRLNNKIFDQNIEISGLINVAQRVLNYSQGKNSVIIKRSKGLKGLNITFKFRK